MQMHVRQTSPLAITSLIAGVLGWTLMPFLGSLVAIVAGHMARGQIRREPERYEGSGLAVAGLILGWSVFLLAVLGILVFVLFFGGLAAIAAMAGSH